VTGRDGIVMICTVKLVLSKCRVYLNINENRSLIHHLKKRSGLFNHM
jgi:hypothetical protein